MRALLVAFLLSVGGLAGCLNVPAADVGSASADAASADGFSLAGHPEFCESEEACDFWDDEYHQYVVYDLDTTVIDVVIVPPAGMTTPDQIATSRLAVQAWSDGIEALGQSWFTDAFEMNVYAVGIDIPSIDAVSDPEIIVISTSAQGILGIGLEPKQIGCILLGEETLTDYGGHAHRGGYVTASDCTGIGFTCFAINLAGTDPRGLYDLIAHEVGHCLGAGHVGDALDFRARYAPVEDIMSYQDNPEQVHCVSNMNVRNLEGVYAHLLDRPEEEWLPRGSYMAFSPADYMQVACENPPGMR
jgi:hypothetical protein